MNPLAITKTPKCYVGGAFIRSESGRVYEMHRSSGEFFANIPRCTRKDVRNAVEAAAKAGAGWAKRTPYNRAQILYRLAEMLEARAPEMSAALMIDGTAPDADEWTALLSAGYTTDEQRFASAPGAQAAATSSSNDTTFF